MKHKFYRDADLAIVADIGGTQMRAGLVDRSGKVLERIATPTEQLHGIEQATQRLLEIMLQLPQSRVAGVGVASAGPMDPKTGIYSHPPSLSAWHGHSMKSILEKNLGMPVSFGHDATMAALAETTFGKFRDVQHFIYLTVSTGIGGGIITNGQIVTGANGYAGEVGHIIINSDSPLKCGGECAGCFESLASGTAVINIAKIAIAGGAKTSIGDTLNGDLSKLTALMVFNHALQGDAVALKIVDDLIDNLATGISCLLSVFDPDGISIGGGVMSSMQRYWDRIETAIKKQALPRFRDGVPVSVTQLGDEICMIGAAAQVFRNAEKAS